MTNNPEKLKAIIRKLVFSSMLIDDSPYTYHLMYGHFRLTWEGSAKSKLNEPVDYFLAKIEELS